MNARRSIIAAAVSAPLVFAGCSASAAPPSAINASLSEFKIASTSATAASGSVTFTVKNEGTVTHEFIVMRTDLASDKLPASAEGKVDEESTELKAIDEVEGLTPGTTKSLTVDLAPGHYVLICNLPGHYAGGMRAEINVVGKS
jgi:uncharacterized cupredoxin-like copper-binding protein